MPTNILVVEDNIDQSHLIQISLSRKSPQYHFDFASSGEEAIGLCESKNFDAIILDYRLPDMSGIDVLSELKNRFIYTPVVVVTGQGDERVAVEAMKRGASDYIVKESDYFNTLPRVIKAVLEKSKLEQELRQKEEFLSSVVERATDVIFSLNENLEFRFVNPRIRILGYEQDELIGKTFFTIVADTQPKDDLRKALSAPQDKNYEVDFVSKSGEIFNYIVSFNYIPKNSGESKELLGIAKDVTHSHRLHRLIKESKNKLQTLFDSITDYIIVVDRDKNIVMANRKVADLCNTTPNKILGKKCYAIYNSDQHRCVNCPVEHTWETGQPGMMERLDGDKTYQMWSYPMFNLDGELEYVIEYSRDVTEQRNIERKLIQSEKLATIGLLASGIAHELRNPLNIIETARYSIQETLQNHNPDVNPKLQIIRRNVQRASSIINNLLEFSRNSAKDREPTDVNVLIDKTLSLIEKDLQSQNILLIKRYGEIPKSLLNVDSLKQVFLNIIINAIHAMPDGGELTISTESIESNYIQVQFKDTGVGISEENIKHIFTPFFTTKESGKGTGLGMYISHSMIKKEGGEILVDSKVGTGTTITVLLPLRNAK